MRKPLKGKAQCGVDAGEGCATKKTKGAYKEKSIGRMRSPSPGPEVPGPGLPLASVSPALGPGVPGPES